MADRYIAAFPRRITSLLHGKDGLPNLVREIRFASRDRGGPTHGVGGINKLPA